MQLSIPQALLSACAVTLLTGCEANQLYIGSQTVIGINAAVNRDLTSGWVVVGYDRSFATVIPRSVPIQDKDDPTPGQKRDAMTVLGCSNLAVNGVTIKRFTESIATGKAAETFARKLGEPDTGNTAATKNAADAKTVKDFFDCFKENNAKDGGASPTQADKA